MMFKNPDTMKKVGFFIFAFLGFVLILSFLTSGMAGLMSVFSTFLKYLLIAVFLGTVFYIVYYLFFAKHRTDVNYVNFQSILASSKLSKPPLLNDLYLRGDKKHMSARLGKIIGYCRLTNIQKKTEEDVFAIQTASFPFTLFSDPQVMRVAVSDHSELIGDIYLNGISLIKLGSFYYLNNAMTDTKMIDRTQHGEGIRQVSHEVLSDMKGLIDIATGIDSEHKKLIEGKNLMTFPMGSSPQRPEDKG